MDPGEVSRIASPFERRSIIREDLKFYNAVVISAVYELPAPTPDLTAHSAFFGPLEACVSEHAFLSALIKDAHTEKCFYQKAAEIDLRDHIVIVHDAEDADEETLRDALPGMLDEPFNLAKPPWRIFVQPLGSRNSVSRCLIAFAFSHSLGDGMVGVTFHRTFLDAWNGQDHSAGEKKSSSVVAASTKPFPEPFDTPERLPISWSFLLGPLLANILPAPIAKLLGLRAHSSNPDEKTWTGSHTFAEHDKFPSSNVQVLEVPHELVDRAVRAARCHGAKLSGLLFQFINRALDKSLPRENGPTNLISGAPLNMRSALGLPNSAWGSFISNHEEKHARVPTEAVVVDDSRAANTAATPPLSAEQWAWARGRTQRLAEAAVRLQDQPIGLLRYVSSIRKWMENKVGDRRDYSYELSNLTLFDGGAKGEGEGEDSGQASDRGRITKMVFAQPAGVPTAPITFSVVSVKGGSLFCVVSWQSGALDVGVEKEGAFVEAVCASIKADFESLP